MMSKIEPAQVPSKWRKLALQAAVGFTLAAPFGPLVIGMGGLRGGLWVGLKAYRGADELMLALNLEAAALTYSLVFAVLGSWEVLAHLGYVAAPQPLDLLTACYLLVLAATYIAIERRRVLKAR